MTKYGAVRTKVDGYTFASKAEAKRYGELRLLERAGEIASLRVHPSWDIFIRNMKVCKVELDFTYINVTKSHVTKSNVIIHEDVKGRDNPVSRLKRKLLKACYGIDVEIVKA